MKKKQLEIDLNVGLEIPKDNNRKKAVKKPRVTELSPIVLPDTKLDLIEQFAIALQNRDRIGLNQLIAEKYTNKAWGTKQDFINKFLSYCDHSEQKYGTVYINTVPGECVRHTCQLGCNGLGVTVCTVADNKLLWSFNLVARQTPDQTLVLWKCKAFSVSFKSI